MSIGLFGKKLGMTQIFVEDGSAVPVTFVKAETCQAVSYTHLRAHET